MNLVDRVKKILITPKSEWAVIDTESQTVASLYTQYVMILAAIPVVASFIGFSVVGYTGFGVAYRVPMGAGLASMVLGYVLSLASVYVIALVIDALAPNFGGEKNFIQSLKVAAFFPTASWICGIFSILPALAILGVIGGLYSLYLLYLGLGPLKKVPEEKTIGYTVVVVIVAIVLMVVISTVAALITPSPMRGF
ncbi:MAG: Yip1 family protein [Usitatibacter sp.]